MQIRLLTLRVAALAIWSIGVQASHAAEPQECEQQDSHVTALRACWESAASHATVCDSLIAHRNNVSLPWKFFTYSNGSKSKFAADAFC